MTHLSPEQLEKETQAIHRRMALQTSASPALRERAAAALNVRLAQWHGDFLPSQGRFKNKIPRGFTNPTTVRTDPIELLIVRAIAMTSTPGAAQFGVSPDGSVFTTDVNGRSLFSGRRIDVTGLSPLLDEAANVFNHRRGGLGGRFYERGGYFFKADGKQIFLEVLDVGAKGFEVGPPGRKRIWQRLTSLLPWSRDDGESALPEWVPPPRRTHVASRREKQPSYCPVHRIELPATGQCDECSQR
jgi:hypothetical protein